MPLTPFQRRVLSTIACHRSPESYVAGGAALQRHGTRSSDDIDIFHDAELVLDTAVKADTAALEAAGYRLRWIRQLTTIHQAQVLLGEESTRLDWAVDTGFRFFPTIADPEFGYTIHPLDLATNKMLAAANRAEPRDSVDLLLVQDQVQPLGAIAEKEPGFTPQGVLAELKWRTRYHDYDLASVHLTTPMSAAELNTRLRALIIQAERLVAVMPRHLEYGALLCADGRLARPDPDDPASLSGMVVHHGSRKGAWPSSPEISSVMLRERPLP